MLFSKHSAKGLFFFLQITLILLFQDVNAQFTEDFEDNDLSVNPEWIGMTGNFIQENGQLRLLAPAMAGSTHIITQSKAVESAVWQWTTELKFNPSGSNFAEFYVVLSDSTINSSASGYMVKIGGTSDEISLYEVTNGSKREIIDGIDKRLDLSNPVVDIKLQRDSLGIWELSSRLSTETDFVSEGSTQNNSHEVSRYFGIRYQYTSTRADKFFVDQIRVEGVPVRDRRPPSLANASIQSDNELQLFFSENINSIESQPEVWVNSDKAAIVKLDSNFLLAETSNSFFNGINNEFEVKGVADLAGNIMPDTIFSIFYFSETATLPNDVIITEIMADPNPEIELPEAEYIELYNASANPKNLKNWILEDATGRTFLDSVILLPQHYLILTANSNTSQLAVFGDVLGVSNWPTLNNTSDRLTIYDNAGLPIHRVNYKKAWYGSEIKQEGGWSLEIIDPANPCGEEQNWRASVDENGGTPGKVNSVNNTNPDQMPPDLDDLYMESETILRADFNERIDSTLIAAIKVSLSPTLEVSYISLMKEDGRALNIHLASPPNPSTSYSVTISDVTDCNGNTKSEIFSTLLIPEEAEPGDLIVNEVLFNPPKDGVDFVEIYNVSHKVINLADWNISNPATGSNSRINGFILKPGQFAALTEDPEILKNDYPLHADSSIISNPLPSLNNESGYVVLRSSSATVIDSIYYEEDMHTEAITNPEGVSLERLSPDVSGMERSNWFSAAETVGFATPGFSNSQRSSENISPNVALEVSPKVFSPDSDGYQDFCELQYSLDRSGLIGSLKLYRINGSLAATIAANELLSDQGKYIWDGRTDRGTEPMQGTYIVVFEVFSTDGYRKIFKDKVSIAGL